MIESREERLNSLYLIAPEEGGGICPLVMRPEQLEFLRGAHSRNIIIKTRKLGFSTLIELEHLDTCITRPHTHCAIVDRTQPYAEEKLAIAKLAWDQALNHPDAVVREAWRMIRARVQLTSANQSEMVFSNGSRIEAGVSFRGGTPQRLHVSEFGPVAAEDNRRAAEIVSGAMAAVPPSGTITIETTFKGGRYGHCYRIARQAMAGIGTELSALDWKFWFFPWWKHPSYVLAGERVLSGEAVAYFGRLEAEHGIVVSREQRQWWDAIKRMQQEAMGQEYPSTEEEVFMARIEGAIYPQMATLRAQGRVTSIDADRSAPVFTAWDIGISDILAGWLIQPVGRSLHWLGWAEFEGEGAVAAAEQIRAWETMLGRKVTQTFLPHDAGTREKGSGLTYVDALTAAGIPRHTVRVVPRTRDIWAGVDAMRGLLVRSWFDGSCDIERKLPDGTILPSGVGCLEGYRRVPPSPSGRVADQPLHDHCSHSSDAARCFAEAWGMGLIDTGTAEELWEDGGKPRVILAHTRVLA
jgi:hypothetical protein